MSIEARILVVDDEPSGTRLLRRLLRDVGHVEVASSGDEGWEIARNGTFDVVVADQRMPGMTGVELLQKVADYDDRIGRILLTGYADLAATVDAINQGRVHAYLHKPSDPEDLRHAVRSLVERAAVLRDNSRLLEALKRKNQELEQALAEVERAQAQLLHSERLSAIGRTAAMIVHDFRSPLAIVRSACREIVRDGGELDDAELRELAGGALHESERMVTMCREVLEATRTSDVAPGRGETDIDGAIEAALVAVAEEASLAGVTLEMDLASGKELPLDEERFRRALVNLAFNGVEAMPEGGMLRVTSHAEPDSVLITVQDEGAGIPDAIAATLFEPFITHGKTGGTGLGLAVVKQVVDAHEGSIEVGKAEGGGAAFHIRLPLTRDR